MMKDKQLVNVTLGEGVVVLNRSGQSRPVVATVLGVEKDDQGEVKTLWLDRLVHRTHEFAFEGWEVSGAVSSVLRRQAA